MVTAESLTRRSGTAFVFPGQGSQHVGMGRAFYDEWPEMRATFDAFDATLDIDLRELCFDGTAEAIQQPSVTQPILLATGIATHEAVTERFGVEPAIVTGHSLGHFTALAAANAMEPATAVTLTRDRGRCMEAAASKDGPGRMVAVLMADPAAIDDACSTRDDVGVALYNAPRQTVISGTSDGVAAVQETLQARSRARFRKLDVGAAFHSPVMASAVSCVEAAMAEVTMHEATVPIVSDVSGETYTAPAIARRDLTTQITSPVDWVTVVETLRTRGIERVVEFPPAGVLSSLVERIAPEIDCLTLETPADAREAFT